MHFSSLIYLGSLNKPYTTYEVEQWIFSCMHSIHIGYMHFTTACACSLKYSATTVKCLHRWIFKQEMLHLQINNTNYEFSSTSIVFMITRSLQNYKTNPDRRAKFCNQVPHLVSNTTLADFICYLSWRCALNTSRSTLKPLWICREEEEISYEREASLGRMSAYQILEVSIYTADSRENGSSTPPMKLQQMCTH